jgi:hypothetical protein
MAMRVAERTWEVLWANWINVRGVMKRVLEDLFLGLLASPSFSQGWRGQ